MRKQTIDGFPIEEALGGAVDEIEILLDFRMAAGAEMVIVGRVEAAQQQAVRT